MPNKILVFKKKILRMNMEVTCVIKNLTLYIYYWYYWYLFLFL